MKKTQAERFWSKVEKIEGGCWLWTGSTFSNGYGCFTVSNNPRKQALAHRWAYEQLVGEIPEGLDLDHILICRTPNCVNPDHLEPVTRQENAKRRELARRLGMTPYAIKKKKGGLQGRDKTHCKRGHELSGDNVYEKNGRRHCRECRKLIKRKLRKEITEDPEAIKQYRELDAERAREYRKRQAGGELQTPNGEKTHCPNGHPYEGDNLYITPRGVRHCRTCVAAANKRAYQKRKARKQNKSEHQNMEPHT